MRISWLKIEMIQKEYHSVAEVRGPLMLIEETSGIKYGELAEIILPTGEKRRAKVLEVEEDKVLLQLFEGTSGINLAKVRVKFEGKGMELGVSPDLLGRIFDGLGRPIDQGPQIIAEKKVNINGNPINPVARDYPS